MIFKAVFAFSYTGFWSVMHYPLYCDRGPKERHY